MARKISSRTVINRKALDAISAGYVDGMEDAGQAFVENVRPPDAAPYGQGLIQSPDWGVWAAGRKVAGGASKPRRLKVKEGITLVAGAGFPARFNVMGTVKQAPNPGWFIGPMESVFGGITGFIKPKVRERLARVR